MAKKDRYLDRLPPEEHLSAQKTLGRKLRIGLIGTGGIAHNYMKGLLPQTDTDLVAGADLIPGKARAYFDKYGVNAHDYTDYREMIKKENLDAVFVCTYNSTHKECSVYALEHGVNVLLEKPMATSVREAADIMRAEKSSGKILSLGFQPRYSANIKAVKDIIASGALGDIFYVRSTAGRRHGIPVVWTDSFIERKTAGVGAVGDIGCYSIDLIMNLLGHPKPLTVSAMTSDRFGKSSAAYTEEERPECAAKFDVEDFATALIRLEGGITFELCAAWYVHLDSLGDTVIVGTKGSLQIPDSAWTGFFNRPAVLFHDIAGKPVKSEFPVEEERGNLFEKKIRDFLDAVITGGKAPVPSSEIIYNQAIINGICDSGKTGREIEIKLPNVD